MKVQELLELLINTEYNESIKGLMDFNIHDIKIHSQAIEPNDIFICLNGETVNGHDFLESALENGALLVIAEKQYQHLFSDHLPIIWVKDTRESLAICSREFYCKESSHHKYIGITGTNGKTSIASYTAQFIELLCNTAITIGTLGVQIYQNQVVHSIQDTGMTTPQASDLNKIIKQTSQEYNCPHIIMEVSSHSLEQKRVYGIPFSTRIFSNLTQDHLDYHITMEQYFQAKKILFQPSANPNKNIINIDDPWGQKLLAQLPSNNTLITYSLNDSKATLYANNIQLDTSGSQFDLHYQSLTIPIHTQLIGEFNIYNLLASIGACLANDHSISQIIPLIPHIQPVHGRLQIVPSPPNKPKCIIDYAHTPDSLEKALSTIKSLSHPECQLICIFGCGGDRDNTKRPLMGKIASTYADQIILTNDNPRTENPDQIISDIMSGIDSTQKVTIIKDRALATQNTIHNAPSNSVILIAGKGHEDYQIMGKEYLPYSDLDEINKAYKDTTN